MRSIQDNSNMQPLWVPAVDNSALAVERFRQHIVTGLGFQIAHYLHGVDESLSIDQFPDFFQGSRLNFSENVLSHTGSKVALVSFTELNGCGATNMTWDELRNKVTQVANSMVAVNVKRGDVVAFIGANTPAPLIVFLAAASLGAIFTSLAGDMGEKAILDRLCQVKPKIMFGDNAYQYKGTKYVCARKLVAVSKILRESAGLQLSILIDNIPEVDHGTFEDQWISMTGFLSRGRKMPLKFEQVPFKHPMLILFSSGTTGVPKAMVHSHGGPLINLLKEHVLHNNLSSADLYYHYSNIGWTMWNIFIGGLLAGASLLLYDGSPFYPSPTEHIKTLISLGATVLGGSPRYFTELRKAGVIPKQIVDVSRVRLLHSTGAVLPAEIWSWMATAFDYPAIMSFSGGTEICGSFVHGSLVHPQYAGEITVKALGIDVDIFDDEGKSCPNGSTGELVIKCPFPNSAVNFWNDDDFSRYRSSYFERFPHVWTQGDFAKVNPTTGGIVILGRSDGVLNPSGIRFGPSEIYAVVSTFHKVIDDSLVVGQRRPIDLDERVLLFVQMSQGTKYTIAIRREIQKRIAQSLSLRHVPKFIVPVKRIPYNVNGKKLETLVKLVVSGGRVDQRLKSTLAQEDDLEVFQKFADENELTPWQVGDQSKL